MRSCLDLVSSCCFVLRVVVETDGEFKGVLGGDFVVSVSVENTVSNFLRSRDLFWCHIRLTGGNYQPGRCRASD